MLFMQQDSVEFFFMMITRKSIWITLLFSLLGSCKTSSSNLNRVLATCKNQGISKEECEKQKQDCIKAAIVKAVCWDEAMEICLPNCDSIELGSSWEIMDSNRMIGGHNKPLVGSGKELRWPPKIGGRDSLAPARASFNNRVGPAGIDWSNPKDVGVKPSGHKPPKKINRLGLKVTNDYDGCLDCLPKKNRMKFSTPHKEKAEKTNRDTNPDPDQCLDCPDDPKPALPKEVKELQNRVGNLEKRVGDLEKVNVTSSTSATTTLENVHPRK